MKNAQKLLQKIFKNHEKLIGKEWTESRKKAFSSIIEMKTRQESMTKEVDNLKEIIKEKDADIARLNSICLEFAKTKISIQK